MEDAGLPRIQAHEIAGDTGGLHAFHERRARGAGDEPVVDTTGAALTEALAARPFLVKPNNHETGSTAGPQPLISVSSNEPSARGRFIFTLMRVCPAFPGQGWTTVLYCALAD